MTEKTKRTGITEDRENNAPIFKNTKQKDQKESNKLLVLYRMNEQDWRKKNERLILDMQV